MVSVNFRVNYGIKKEDILNFLKNIGYEHIGTNSTSIKVEDEYLNTDIFVKNTRNSLLLLRFLPCQLCPHYGHSANTKN